MNTMTFYVHQNTLHFVYIRIKGYIFPFCVMFGCLLLILYFILPQWQDYLDTKAKEEALKQKIAVLKQNDKFLSSLDENTIASNYQLVSSALPSEKDFVGIINAIADSSAASGVKLGDFGLSIGSLSTPSAQVQVTPTFSVGLQVTGDLSSLRNFIQRLSQSFPISQITAIAESQQTFSVEVNFFYKALPLNTIPVDAPVKPLSKSASDLLNTLLSWQQNASVIPTPQTTQPLQQPASSSAILILSPTPLASSSAR